MTKLAYAKCPYCGEAHSVSSGSQGVKIDCRACGHLFTSDELLPTLDKKPSYAAEAMASHSQESFLNSSAEPVELYFCRWMAIYRIMVYSAILAMFIWMWQGQPSVKHSQEFNYQLAMLCGFLIGPFLIIEILKDILSILRPGPEVVLAQDGFYAWPLGADLVPWAEIASIEMAGAWVTEPTMNMRQARKYLLVDFVGGKRPLKWSYMLGNIFSQLGVPGKIRQADFIINLRLLEVDMLELSRAVSIIGRELAAIHSPSSPPLRPKIATGSSTNVQ